ncbi:MAG: hypothetical protein WDO16_03960 [Bacteroidota bacterium]
MNINQTLVLDGAVSVQDSVYQNTFQPFKTEMLQQRGIKARYCFHQRDGEGDLLDKWCPQA